MKKYMLPLVAAALLLAVAQTRPTQGAPEKESRADSLVGDVYFPERLELAGEVVPLWRQDVAEAARRELIVNSYFHSHTVQILKNAPRYFARLEPILREEGVPDDFKYLAAAESAFNPLAVSPAGAAGVWQFIKSSAKEYGLEVNDEVDERYHLEKATRAACRYLKKAKERFGSWTLAAAAYNTGEKNVAKQIEIQQETSYYDLLMAEETNRYVFRILALKQIIERPALYGFQLPESYSPETFIEITVARPVDNLALFAKERGVSYKTLKRFNPWLRANTLNAPPGKSYRVAFPENPKAYR
ncbi:MAG: lytic transglycosylase domain-containing protein [Odoribacteraceae bacterium]|jgi:hypothetical protein|nr:lytic transglycosylase domain-containing protein [Odoribacteraceae bacterium]